MKKEELTKSINKEIKRAEKNGEQPNLKKQEQELKEELQVLLNKIFR